MTLLQLNVKYRQLDHYLKIKIYFNNIINKIVCQKKQRKIEYL